MRIRVAWRLSVALTGTVLKWLAVPLCFPLLVGVYYGEALLPFLTAIAVTLSVGVGLERLEPDARLGPREAFLMVALSWLSVALVGMIPFLVAGDGTIAHPLNAAFESMSGVTTTGATVLLDFDAHSRAIMMWRQVIQWLGGLGILILAVAILSRLSVGGAQLMETETQTQDVNKLTPHITNTARLIGSLYLGLTTVAVLALYALKLVDLAPNMTLYNAIAHALTSVGTAGFSPEPESIQAFEPIAQWMLMPFMILGSTSFVLLYFLVQGRVDRLYRSEEFRFYLGTMVVFGALITAVLLLKENPTGEGLHDTIRQGTFNTVSIVTTTGYANSDFNQWSPFAKHLLFMCMFTGGMAGSTTCSIKSIRWLVILKAFRRDLFTAAHPEVVRPVRISGDPVDEESIRDIYSYTMVAIIGVFLLTVLIVIDGARAGVQTVTEFDAMGAAASTFLNIGPAFGEAGPFGSYVGFPAPTKFFMILLMWVGRIEIIPVLVLLSPAFWRS